MKRKLPENFNEHKKEKSNDLNMLIDLLSNSRIENLHEIGRKIHISLPLLYPNLQTRKNVYVQLRKHVKQKFSAFPKAVQQFNAYFHISRKESFELKKDYANKVFERHCSQQKIDDYKFLKFIKTAKNSDKWQDLMIVVALSCGSRMIEIAKLSDFTPIDNEFISISGVAKNRSKETKIIVRPLIGITTIEFIEILKRLRSYLNSKIGNIVSNSKISWALSPSLQKHVKEYFGIKFTFHQLRATYAAISWKTYGHLTTMTKIAFISLILGHKEGSLTSALSYERFY